MFRTIRPYLYMMQSLCFVLYKFVSIVAHKLLVVDATNDKAAQGFTMR